MTNPLILEFSVWFSHKKDIFWNSTNDACHMIIAYISARINHVQLFLNRIEGIYPALKFSDSNRIDEMYIFFKDILMTLDKTKQLILDYKLSILESLLMLMTPELNNITSIVLFPIFLEEPNWKSDLFNYKNRLKSMIS